MRAGGAPQSPDDAIGIAPGQPNEADAALTIDRTAFEVASYRLQAQTPPAAGTLYAVSTRAHIGTQSDQQLIAGFVVNGAPGTTKRVLLRGDGPALAPYGITDYLPNPMLTLYRIGNPNTVVASNDDWGTEPNASEIAAGGGTQPAAGSLDSALLLDLAPGNYTANITSADGTEGESIVEAYEEDSPNTNRLIALSTRGYVSLDHPMIAGFIVHGDPGTTKRIVVRGQGPSLALQGVSSAMYDPYMELHNSTGDLILTNDDWAATSANGDDFQPVVTYYDEQQIYAAGMAPGNRREPCIMVDLPPGQYTAILSPYHDSTQPEEPGVGLIEVYEIQ